MKKVNSSARDRKKENYQETGTMFSVVQHEKVREGRKKGVLLRTDTEANCSLSMPGKTVAADAMPFQM